MSLRPDNTLISNREMLLELLAAPFRAISAVLQRWATSTARMQTLRELNAITDEELQMRGLSRAELVSMTFRHDA